MILRLPNQKRAFFQKKQTRASAHWSFDYLDTIVWICGTKIGVPKKISLVLWFRIAKSKTRVFSDKICAQGSFDYFLTIVFMSSQSSQKKIQPCFMILRLPNQKQAFFQTKQTHASVHWSFDYLDTIVWICGTKIGVPKNISLVLWFRIAKSKTRVLSDKTRVQGSFDYF